MITTNTNFGNSLPTRDVIMSGHTNTAIEINLFTKSLTTVPDNGSSNVSCLFRVCFPFMMPIQHYSISFQFDILPDESKHKFLTKFGSYFRESNIDQERLKGSEE